MPPPRHATWCATARQVESIGRTGDEELRALLRGPPAVGFHNNKTKFIKQATALIADEGDCHGARHVRRARRMLAPAPALPSPAGLLLPPRLDARMLLGVDLLGRGGRG